MCSLIPTKPLKLVIKTHLQVFEESMMPAYMPLGQNPKRETDEKITFVTIRPNEHMPLNCNHKSLLLAYGVIMLTIIACLLWSPSTSDYNNQFDFVQF